MKKLIVLAALLAGCGPAHAMGICMAGDGVATTLHSSDAKHSCEINGGKWFEFPDQSTIVPNTIMLPNYQFSPKQTKWSDHVESVENEGDPSCNHSWATQSLRVESFASCLVIHGPCGCPDTWPYFGRVCRKCMRKEIVRSRCETVDPPKSEYEVLDERIKK